MNFLHLVLHCVVVELAAFIALTLIYACVGIFFTIVGVISSKEHR